PRVGARPSGCRPIRRSWRGGPLRTAGSGGFGGGHRGLVIDRRSSRRSGGDHRAASDRSDPVVASEGPFAPRSRFVRAPLRTFLPTDERRARHAHARWELAMHQGIPPMSDTTIHPNGRSGRVRALLLLALVGAALVLAGCLKPGQGTIEGA